MGSDHRMSERNSFIYFYVYKFDHALNITITFALVDRGTRKHFPPKPDIFQISRDHISSYSCILSHSPSFLHSYSLHSHLYPNLWIEKLNYFSPLLLLFLSIHSPRKYSKITSHCKLLFILTFKYRADF